MDASQTCSNLPAPFLVKTYDMIEDPLSDAIVSWSQNGLSFVVWNPPDFSADLLPLYFKHSNFSSFIRQLNTYGFRKIDPEQWEFANEEFIRGHKHLLKNIHRKKPIHSHSGQGSLPLTDSERQEFIEEIDRLKHEKLLLESDLQKLADDKKGHDIQVQALGQRLNAIKNRLRQMINGLTKQHPSEASNKKRRSLMSNLLFLEEESSISSNNPSLSIDKLESSMDFWENFLQESSKESPPKSSGIDVNLEPAIAITTDDPKEADAANPAALLPTGKNDRFWEQFLTETPGSENQEVQSARRDVNLIQDDQPKPYWWNQHNKHVNNLTEQMGHLTSTEKT